jgi:hypothetical protein
MDTAIEAGATIEDTKVRFEACAGFRRSVEEPLLCRCGWLEDDHGELAAVRLARRRRRPAVVVPERRAS